MSGYPTVNSPGKSRWDDVALPAPQRSLFETETRSGADVHVAGLGDADGKHLPVRMAEYALLIWRIYKRFPQMYVLYVGSQRLRMPSELDTP